MTLDQRGFSASQYRIFHVCVRTLNLVQWPKDSVIGSSKFWYFCGRLKIMNTNHTRFSLLTKYAFVNLFFVGCSFAATAQVNQLIGIFATKALVGAFSKEIIPLYSVFDVPKLTHQDIKRLKAEYNSVSKEIGRNPKNTDLYITRGIILDTLALHEKAYQDFRKAYDMGDRRRKVFMELGIINYRMSSRKESFSYFKRIIDKDSLDADAHLHGGIALLYTANRSTLKISDRAKEAIPYFEKCAKIKPDSKEAHLLLGYCYSLQKKKEDAIKQYQQAITLRPKSFSSYLLLGQIYLEDKDYTNACLVFEKAKSQEIIIPDKYIKKACKK